MFNLRQSEGETEKFSEEGSDISHLSSETKISMNVQQVTSRYHAIQMTVKVGRCLARFFLFLDVNFFLLSISYRTYSKSAKMLSMSIRTLMKSIGALLINLQILKTNTNSVVM